MVSEMKVLLIAINAKYVHTNLAVRYLKKAAENVCDVDIMEYSINDSIFSVERSIMLAQPDIVAFSCYIWNMDFILQLCSDLKKALPATKIILGGPEVSYDSGEVLRKYDYLDYVIIGEGEFNFPQLLQHIDESSSDIPSSVTYRNGNEIITGVSPEPIPLDVISFPYDGSISELDGRIIYYESSRGCPYACKYCLSGERGNVRFRSLELVYKELKFFADNNVSLVKFVDRTFNADKKRAENIWQYIDSLNTSTRFHMEITGELITDEAIDLLKKVNPENLQFEIGVQSTNTNTLNAIDRRCNNNNLFKSISRLLSETDIHIHLDLIAGLPYEDFDSFKKSFNDVVALRPHVLQIGFLKLLKGSSLRDEAEKYAMIYRDNAPYEIIANNFISYEEILFLKDLDFVFDKYYNSSSFTKTINFLFERFENKFEMFSEIVNYFRKHGYINATFSKAKLYDILYDCFGYIGNEFADNLKFDLIKAMHPGKLPDWCKADETFRFSDEVYLFLKNEEIKKNVIPKYFGVPAKIIIKHVRFEKFTNKILMFDFRDNEVYDVTEYFNTREV